MDHERMADQQRLEVGRAPAPAGDHRLLQPFGLHLGHLPHLLLQLLPHLDGGTGQRRVVLGGRPGQIVLELALLVADHRLHLWPECEPEPARAEVEDAAAALVEVAIGDDPVLQLGA